jgi:hypothetical protein
MTEPLSPAAQAVLAAVTQALYGLDPDDIPNEAARMASVIAPAIRTLAATGSASPWNVNQLFAIAAELEGVTTTTTTPQEAQ